MGINEQEIIHFLLQYLLIYILCLALDFPVGWLFCIKNVVTVAYVRKLHYLCNGMRKMAMLIMVLVAIAARGESLPNFVMPSHEMDYVDSVQLQVSDNDTFYLAHMHEIWVYPKMVFKNKQQERFYWKTVRDVKKTLPFAKLLTKEMEYALAGIDNNLFAARYNCICRTRQSYKNN